MKDYPLIRRLLRFQLLTLVAGLALVLALNALLYHAESKAVLQRDLGATRHALAPVYEQLLSWKALGMDETVSRELAKLRQTAPLERLEVASDPVPSIDEHTVLLPDKAQPSVLGYRLIARVHGRPSFFSALPATTLAAIGLFSALFLVCVGVSGLLIRDYFRTIVVLLEKALRELEAGRAPQFEAAGAEGEVRRIIQVVNSLYSKARETERAAALGSLAAQVAHDIRSPLAALDAGISDVLQLPEEKRLLVRGAVARIHDIANNLIAQDRQSHVASGSASETASRELLSSHVAPLITEKRLKFRSKIRITIEDRLDANAYGLFAEIQPTEFKRVLSNLIDNAVEALGERGWVRIDMAAHGDRIVLRIRDNGKGIPPDVLPRLGRRGETYGKTGGVGLGVYHAKKSVESWGGTLELESEPGKGTTATVRLPRASPPAWFIEALTVGPDQPIVVLDDDSSIHQVWRGRFESARVQELGIESFHYSAPAELRAWVEGNPLASRAVFLLDHELMGHQETGLSLIAELGLSERAILVTSHFEEKTVLAECERRNVRMIPKSLAGFVPIKIDAARRAHGVEGRRRPGSPDAVLIDNDDLVLMTWKMAAKEKGLELMAVKTSRSLLGCADRIAPETPVYLDSELGDGLKGDQIALQLHAMGFSNLYIATGRSPESFPPMPWIKRIVGKEPPWS